MPCVETAIGRRGGLTILNHVTIYHIISHQPYPTIANSRISAHRKRDRHPWGNWGIPIQQRPNRNFIAGKILDERGGGRFAMAGIRGEEGEDGMGAKLGTIDTLAGVLEYEFYLQCSITGA